MVILQRKRLNSKRPSSKLQVYLKEKQHDQHLYYFKNRMNQKLNDFKKTKMQNDPVSQERSTCA